MLRRICVIVTSMCVAAFLLHKLVASALLSRGDDHLQRGRPLAALRYYDRALFFEHHLDEAIDRITLVALMTKDHSAMQTADRLTAQTLREYPNDGTFLSDRALIELRLLRFRNAMNDFQRLGYLRNDWQGFAFASFLARKLGDVHMAERDWTIVERLNPRFARFHLTDR